MKRIIVCLIGFLWSSQQLYAHNLVDVIEKTLPSITYIEVENFVVDRVIDPATQTIKETRRRSSPILGTGFVIEGNKVVTNHHVVSAAIDQQTKVYVSFHGSAFRHEATIIGYDEAADVALLSLEGRFPSLIIADDTDSLQMGEDVFSISNLFSLRHSSTFGIVSSNNRIDGRYPYIELLQLQILEGSGSSGGPVLDGEGRVVSLNHTIMSMNPDSALMTPRPSLLSSLSFTIRGDQIIESVERIKREGVVKRVDLAVSLSPYGPISERFLYGPVSNGNGTTGILVDSLDSISDARFRINDIIVSVEGQAFVDPAAFLTWLDNAHNPGDTINVQVYRDGALINITTELGFVRRSDLR